MTDLGMSHDGSRERKRPSSNTAPQRKVIAATVGSSVGAAVGSIAAILVVSFAYPVLDRGGAEFLEGERNTLTTGITTIVTAAVTFLFGYQVPPGAGERSMQKDENEG